MTALSTAAVAQSPVQLSPVTVQGAAPGASLTVPDTEGARRAIEQTPGAVSVVSDKAWRETPATTLKDVLDYTPGVFVQPKWGEDSRLSIRGSGLSRNFHMRGVAILQDGVPVNASDGSSDFQELDPTAFRYTEVYKGANALRYGSNYVGGAINFVSPTGYDADLFDGRADIGSFGFRRLQGSTGGNNGVVDGYVTGSWQAQDGFRDHSNGESKRASGNVGWRITPDLETRFYFNAVDLKQYIPGSVTRDSALNDPRKAAAGNLLQNYQRNMESLRVANKTTLKLGNTKLEVGGYAVDKALIHPIFQYLDYDYRDFGAFARVVDEREIGGRRNRLTVGTNVAFGSVDNKQYVNLPGGRKGNLLSASKDKSLTTSVYAEDSFEVVRDVSVVAGAQYVQAKRKRVDRFQDATDTSGDNTYDFLNPKLGLLWQVDPGWQVFANVSRSGEAPTFGELNFTNTVLADTKAQRATTFEIGTRGRRPDYSWDLALYRMNLKNEFQFFDLGGGNFQVTNADRTIHQGIEAGGGVAVAKGLLSEADRLWVNAAYTFSDFRFDGDRDWGDNKLPGAPRHYLRAELLYRSPDGFYFGPNVEWVPQAYYVDNANSLKTESYALLGFRAGYDFNEHVSLFLDARNLLDTKYIASSSVAAVANPNSPLFEPGTGIAAYGGLRLRW
ncbi:TonB-dependent receptor family protein [Allostella humosa]|uniref:TonB-dependent receptor family protein n=1 Tax=Stella humosa TaxID=94 RepID=UPI0018D6A66B|nr:TonB-dependent receptor [Stella humosa]